ncbi:histidine ammonia-lyase [Desulfofundulus sp. TPOSR]|uniref:histidine ammonia-lyase n=1 Tax=Desulfofundulus sp. TPOSR TaxID=2714340 RepID=UPI00140A2725|nr:histidine ammonia-lyase [Desulfofundulus sp. TPOSR]NHM26497.1 histidine ammonia-lyase [Desulfofundulus sp. TPOSR]
MIETKAALNSLFIDGNSLTLDQVLSVARKNMPVSLGVAGKANLLKSRKIVEKIISEGLTVYGVTTGFGKFSEVTVSREDCNALQKNIIMSHAGGVGDPLPRDAVRAMMILRANSLTKGYSGVRMEVVQLLLDMLNKGIHPVVPCKGSVGASGDLVPLAHIALAMIGLGEVEYLGQVMPSEEAFKMAKLRPVSLAAKEGLALINGTQYMSALGCLAVADALELVKAASIAAAMTFEALEGIPSAYDPRIHDVRPHAGQRSCALAMRKLLEGSELLTRTKHKRVQDAYTLRCIPQVHGASLDAINYVRGVLETEINSATDNPLIFPDSGCVISGGNFHGQPLALALDYLALAVSELGGISERRLERLVNPALNGDLPPFLTQHGGLNSGMMILQYVAAALASENKVLSHPASVDSIPTSANQEDHVSMGSIAALKARSVVENVSWIVAAEMLAASQALDFVSHTLGAGSRIVHRLIREVVPHWHGDRILYRDLHRVRDLLLSGLITERVEQETGPLI